MPLKKAQKVYCIETNEIFPSLSFVKDRVISNIWLAVQEPTRTAAGRHWRYATPEDLLVGKEVTAADYPNKKKPKKKIIQTVENGQVQEVVASSVRRGWSSEEIENWKKAKTIADSMTNYLNQLESIFTSPMSENEKLEAFNMAALFVGKLIVSFCDFCETQEIYVERGARGGKIKTKKVEENKEDDYEYEEVENA